MPLCISTSYYLFFLLLHSSTSTGSSGSLWPVYSVRWRIIRNSDMQKTNHTYIDIILLLKLYMQVLPSISIEEVGVTYSLCWTTDLDYFFHMNNGKYFKEMDFARWGKKTTTRHNHILVPGSTSIFGQAAPPTLRPNQRCLSFNMERASDIEGEQLTIKLLSFKDKYFKC